MSWIPNQFLMKLQVIFPIIVSNGPLMNFVDKLFAASAINIEKGSFAWSQGEQPILKDINIEIKPGKLVAVVGQVGAGKSSLISAILGEMEKLGGKANTNGKIAYIPQQAWIQNCSLRNNIMFGKTYNESFYNKVINACALKPDLAMLPGGDSTEIGEKVIQSLRLYYFCKK
jgi:ATP-binding cassette subfamily C (CFTR/MRP) protein 1